MNLFYLDTNIDRCAEYHIDKHVGKMQLEAAQLMTATIWVDKHLGFVPRKLTSEELGIINDAKHLEPSIDDRVFTRYLPTHINHPCAIWARSSLDHHYWIICYIEALNQESQWRGNKSHASCKEALRMPEPLQLPNKGWSTPALAMPEQYKCNDPVKSYRSYYRNEKSSIATWKKRGNPDWWTHV